MEMTVLFASGIRAYYTCSACLFMARRDSEVWDEQVHHVRGDYVCHQVQLVGYLLTNEINIWVSRDEKVIRSSDWQVVIINKLMTVARRVSPITVLELYTGPSTIYTLCELLFRWLSIV